MTVYNQDPALRGRVDNLWDNDPEMDSTYNGGDITLNKRLSNGWMMTGGLSMGKNVGYVGVADLNNPNSKDVQPRHPGRRRAVVVPHVRVCTSCPYGLSLSGSYQYPERLPGVDDRLGRQQHRGADAGAQTVNVNARGDVRYPTLQSGRLQPSQGDSHGDARCSSRGWTSTTRQQRDDPYVGHDARATPITGRARFSAGRSSRRASTTISSRFGVL